MQCVFFTFSICTELENRTYPPIEGILSLGSGRFHQFKDISYKLKSLQFTHSGRLTVQTNMMQNRVVYTMLYLVTLHSGTGKENKIR